MSPLCNQGSCSHADESTRRWRHEVSPFIAVVDDLSHSESHRSPDQPPEVDQSDTIGVRVDVQAPQRAEASPALLPQSMALTARSRF